jgi:anti-sigma factor RsiW
MSDRPDNPVPEEDLHAYVDGALAPERRAAVEEWLAMHPETAATVAQWRAQNDAILRSFGSVAAARDERDDDMVAAAATRAAAAPRKRLAWPVAAAFALFFAAGVGTGALLTASLSGGVPVAEFASLPRASKANYLIYASEVRHPVEVTANEEEHLVTWLGNRIGKSLTAPDLGAEGFQLVGGRLVPFAEKPGAMLMYEDAAGERVTVLIGTNPDHTGTGFRFAQGDGVSTFYWTDGGFGYAMSGAVDRETLLGLARVIYVQN